MQNFNTPVGNAFIITDGQFWNICSMRYVSRYRTYIVNMFAYVLPIINASKLNIYWNTETQNH